MEEPVENKVSQNLLKGIFLSFCSGTLFTINHAVIQDLQLDYFILTFIWFLVQTFVLLILIKLSGINCKTTQAVETTPLTGDETIIDTTALWVHQVD